MKTEEIDIVLAWVDGSDPVWREKKKERIIGLLVVLQVMLIINQLFRLISWKKGRII